jgi:hypothetical protein
MGRFSSAQPCIADLALTLEADPAGSAIRLPLLRLRPK